MHLSRFAALAAIASTFVAVVYAEIDSNCSSAPAVFVTVTAIPVTKTVSIPFEVSPSITNNYDEPPKLQVALDSLADVTAPSTDDITLIHKHTTSTIPAISTTALSKKGPYYFTTDKNGITVWLGGNTPPTGVRLATSTTIITVQPVPISSLSLSGGSSKSPSYSTVFLTVIGKGHVTETITKSAPAVIASSAVSISSYVSVSSSNASPLASTVSLIETTPLAATASLIPTISSRTSTGLGVNGWNVTFKTLLKEKLLGSTNEPAKLLSQQTGVKENSVSRTGTASLSATSSNKTITTGVRKPRSTFSSPIEGAFVSWTQVLPTESCASSKISSVEPPSSHVSIPSRQPNVPKSVQNKLVVSLSSIRKPTPIKLNTASTLIFSHSSKTSKTAVTETPSCIGKARFTINFDDLPHSSISAEDVQIPQIVNPYHKLFFEKRYRYVHLPNDPFRPVSPPQLAVYRAGQGINVDGSPDADLELIGEFGAGPRASDSAFWIDAFSLWLGCENAGPSNCVVTINGYDSAHSIRAVSKTVILPPCLGLVNCKLTLIELPDNFRNLAGIQILPAVDRKLTAFFIDDVSLGWSNNTCAAQRKRSSES